MTELDRIRAEYTRRARDPRLCSLYSLFRPDVQFARHTLERKALGLLLDAGYEPLSNLNILEMGCGGGGMLLDLVRWGASPERLHGCDLLPERVQEARRRLPPLTTLTVADGGALPYPAARFDLVLQFTVITSILDPDLQRLVAQEMWRVLRPGGAVLWYDFRVQGRNPAVQAIPPQEVRQLFPQGKATARRVTLAPPVSRRLAPISWLLCEFLERIPWLRTHDLILIGKREA